MRKNTPIVVSMQWNLGLTACGWRAILSGVTLSTRHCAVSASYEFGNPAPVDRLDSCNLPISRPALSLARVRNRKPVYGSLLEFRPNHTRSVMLHSLSMHLPERSSNNFANLYHSLSESSTEKCIVHFWSGMLLTWSPHSCRSCQLGYCWWLVP